MFIITICALQYSYNYRYYESLRPIIFLFYGFSRHIFNCPHLNVVTLIWMISSIGCYKSWKSNVQRRSHLMRRKIGAKKRCPNLYNPSSSIDDIPLSNEYALMIAQTMNESVFFFCFDLFEKSTKICIKSNVCIS